MTPKIIGMIPARYASTRFPGKPLTDIGGKSMIQRVYEQASQANLDDLYVATDSTKIYNHVIRFGGQCLMTSDKHQSGTERCEEGAKKLQLQEQDVLINIQGDEPFIKPEQISLLKNCFNEKNTELATLIKKAESLAELQNPNIPKVIINKLHEAIYFSRSIIPYMVKTPHEEALKSGAYFKHIGIYAYRIKTLYQISELPPSFLEQSESLEQLRWIENGFKIKTAQTTMETIAIDTPDDLEKALAYLKKIS